MNNKNQWGLFFYISAIVLSLICIFIALKYPYPQYKFLYKNVIPITGLTFSFTAFFAGHFSYPRVHNIKIYLSGYITGLFGVSYFLLYKTSWLSFLPKANIGFLIILYFLMCINFIGTNFLPSFLKYRTVRQITLIVITFEAVIIFLFRISPQTITWAKMIAPYNLWDYSFLGGIFLFLLPALFSFAFVRREFFLGGLLSGWAFFFAPAWASNVWFLKFNPLESILFAAMPLYFTVCTLIHWFLRMEHRVSYDPLLHIYNRDFCSKIITEQSNINTTPPFTVAMIDIDHFKNVNDTYGHQAGDTILYNVAQAIQNEALPWGIVCRYGGEEIAVFFPQKTTKEVEIIMEKTRKTIQKMKNKTKKKPISVTVSCGISTREDLSQSVIDVIHSADKALYRAKKEGRNRVCTAKTPVNTNKKK